MVTSVNVSRFRYLVFSFFFHLFFILFIYLYKSVRKLAHCINNDNDDNNNNDNDNNNNNDNNNDNNDDDDDDDDNDDDTNNNNDINKFPSSCSARTKPWIFYRQFINLLSIRKTPLPVDLTSIYLTQISGNRYHERVLSSCSYTLSPEQRVSCAG